MQMPLQRALTTAMILLISEEKSMRHAGLLAGDTMMSIFHSMSTDAALNAANLASCLPLGVDQSTAPEPIRWSSRV